MRSHGWRGTLALAYLTITATTVPALGGGYVLSVEGIGSDLDPGPQFGVLPGQQFDVAAILSGDVFASHDSAIFDVGVQGPRSLIYNTYLWDPVAFATGGDDDFSIPEVDPGTGLFPSGLKPLIDNNLYVPVGPNPPVRADVHFEALARPGETFTVGTLVTLTLKMPADAQVGEKFIIEPFPGAFVLGFDTIPTEKGASLGVVVVPEPTTLILMGLGGLAAARRRLLSGS